MWMRRVIFLFSERAARARGGGGGRRCQNFLFFIFFPCSADHKRDWPPCKVDFFGLATNALNVRNNSNNNNIISHLILSLWQLDSLDKVGAGYVPNESFGISPKKIIKRESNSHLEGAAFSKPFLSKLSHSLPNLDTTISPFPLACCPIVKNVRACLVSGVLSGTTKWRIKRKIKNNVECKNHFGGFLLSE